ncbi:hypothetical protein FRZ00_32985 [Streptomyces mobaraensis]|uniref:Uncharacterized protein n=1 Tax=Streptomyces mobaraensis TaxID=35621 RepID=A0A5N5VXT1_STRMB|nr:hypothetical protein FRZ00_32985 [Streptomyces mobaraensis]
MSRLRRSSSSAGRAIQPVRRLRTTARSAVSGVRGRQPLQETVKGRDRGTPPARSARHHSPE